MTPDLQQFVNQAGTVMFRSAAITAGLGFVAGLFAGVCVFAGLSLAGMFRGGHRLAPLGRVLAGLVIVVGTATMGAVAGGSGGAYAGAAPALLGSELGPRFFEPAGELATLVSVRAVVAAPELVGVTPPEGAPTGDDAIEAVADRTWAIPVAHVRAVAAAYGAAVRGPQGEEVSRALAERLATGLPTREADLVRRATLRFTSAVHSGKDVGSVEATLEDAWGALDAASAVDGAPGTLSHDDLKRLAIDRLILPIGLRPLLAVAVTGVVASLVMLVPIWVLPVAFAWLARRLGAARPREDAQAA